MRILACLAAVFLSGCQTAQTPATGPAASADVAALPADYRQQILARAKAEFFDPYSIRDAGISQPIGGTSLMGSTSTICVRANAKNRMGAYTGLRTTAYIFRRGQITLSDQQYASIACGSAAYEPFPELEAGATTPQARPRA